MPPPDCSTKKGSVKMEKLKKSCFISCKVDVALKSNKLGFSGLVSYLAVDLLWFK